MVPRRFIRHEENLGLEYTCILGPAAQVSLIGRTGRLMGCWKMTQQREACDLPLQQRGGSERASQRGVPDWLDANTGHGGEGGWRVYGGAEFHLS